MRWLVPILLMEKAMMSQVLTLTIQYSEMPSSSYYLGGFELSWSRGRSSNMFWTALDVVQIL
jgi:hypothetical protein